MTLIHGDIIYTGNKIIENGYLAFEADLITIVSSKKPTGPVTRFPVITPAFIDPHSHIGMHRAGEPEAEGEVNDQMDAILPLADALDSVQMDDPAFAQAIEMGVLYSCVLPGSGNILSGRGAIIRNYGGNTSAALIARAGVKAALGHNPRSTTQWKGARPFTRMGAMSLLRKCFSEVSLKMRNPEKAARGAQPPELGPEEKIIRDLLERRNYLRVHVHKGDDVAALLRFLDEFKLDITVEHTCAVDEKEIFDALKERRIPVTYGPIDAFAYKIELRRDNWRNIHPLLDSGCEFGLMTDHPFTPAYQLLLQTRWFLRAGYSKQQCIELISRKNAEILKIDHLLGTLDKGKWASFLCWNGDPFDLANHPVAIYAEGKKIVGDS